MKRYFVIVPKRRGAQNSLRKTGGSTWVGQEVEGTRGKHGQEAFIVASVGEARQSRVCGLRIV